MRKKIVAGNWKMNLISSEAEVLMKELENNFDKSIDVEVIVFPSFLFLNRLVKLKSNIKIGAQNFHPNKNGAFTGESSVSQIIDSGATHVLIGHSERRIIFNENESFLKDKVNSALDHDLNIVFCCGEPLEERESGNYLQFVKKQLIDSLFHLDEVSIKKCVIAYEPVWAIGTGKTASSQQAEEMHSAIRTLIKEHYNNETAEQISILYGGSCNASNAAELFACPNVDGGLIGGASLIAESFNEITRSF